MAPLSPEEKRGALERVLQSRALRRSEPLRALLRYVCEAELEGRGQLLTEQTLGVAVLGRSAGYSPAEDAGVRSRVYELRRKLHAYYESEAPDDPVRIELAKGRYVPRFTRAAQGTSAVGSDPPSPSRPPPLSAELAALWGPLLEGDAPLLIAFEVRLFFFSPATGLVVRDYRCNSPAEVAASAPLNAFRHQTGERELLETRDYTDFGTAHAAFLLGRLLATSRRDVVLKHTPSLDWQDVFNHNVVFIGKPDTNPIIRSLLQGQAFTDDQGTIHNLYPRAGEAAEYRCAATHGTGEKHALVTRIRGPQSGHHLLLLCGAGAELLWALAQGVTHPEHVREIMGHLRLPSGEYPKAFQVVVQATFQANVPTRIRYVTHRALDG